MTTLDIAQIGNPVLRNVAREVDADELASDETQRLIDDMIETKRDADGAGIAAPQVHRSVRIAVVEVVDNKRYPYKPAAPLDVIVNPTLEPVGDRRYLNNEGCLSVPNIRGELWRFESVIVSGLDRFGQPFSKRVDGLTAGTYQHEVDHLNGKVFLDRVEDSRSFMTWDEFEAHHRTEFLERVAGCM